MSEETPNSRSPFHARLGGILSPSIGDKTVGIIGAGGGSSLALSLVRMGIGGLVTCDFDVVEVANLARTAFTRQDVGETKVDALGRHVESIRPDCSYDAICGDVTRLTAAERQRLERCDLLIAATDSFDAQLAVNEISLSENKPAVFIGVHERARGGIVSFQDPARSRTACYSCLNPHRRFANQEGARVDLDGERGALVDITFIDSVAAKLVLGILERGKDTEYGRFLERIDSRTQVVVRTSPAYQWDGGVDIFDIVLGDLDPTSRESLKRNYHACDSVWLDTDDLRRPECRCQQRGSK